MTNVEVPILRYSSFVILYSILFKKGKTGRIKKKNETYKNCPNNKKTSRLFGRLNQNLMLTKKVIEFLRGSRYTTKLYCRSMHLIIVLLLLSFDLLLNLLPKPLMYLKHLLPYSS